MQNITVVTLIRRSPQTKAKKDLNLSVYSKAEILRSAAAPLRMTIIFRYWTFHLRSRTSANWGLISPPEAD